MKPLIVLIIAFIISVLTIKGISSEYIFALAGRIAMALMLIFTSIAHFAFTKGMTMMIPGFIPFKKTLVYLTGIIEILAAIALLIPGLTEAAGWLLILFFILLLPANINAAVQHIDYERGTFTGSGTGYLWFRIPLQILFIGWIYFSAIQF